MKIPRYTAQTPPPRSSGLVRASDIGALTQSGGQAKWSGVGAFGRGLSFAGQLAFRASQNRRALDDEIESGKAIQMAKDDIRIKADAAWRYNATADMPLPDDPNYLKTVTTFDTIKRDNLVDEARKDFLKNTRTIFSGIKSPEVKARLENWLAENAGKMTDQLRKIYGGKLDDYQLGELNKLMEAAAQNGDVASADKYADLMDKFELITHTRAQALKRNNILIADKSITSQLAHAILNQTGRQDAIDYVMAQDIDVEIKKDIVADINFEAKQQTDRLEIARENDRNEIAKLIRSGKSATARIENSYLDEKEQWTWFERERAEADRLARGKQIATNEQVKGQLESMAYDIASGTVTMPQLKKRLDDERYTKQTIDDAAYDEIFSLAERKFESYQAGAMKEREVHALGQLVTHPSEFGLEEKLRHLTSQFAKDQERALRQLQFDNLDRYKKALRDWLKTKPDADADEIYTEGRKLLKHYRKSPKQLRQEAETIYPKMPTDKKILEAAKKVASGKSALPEPNTIEEFESTVSSIEDEEEAKAYYQKWKNKW